MQKVSLTKRERELGLVETSRFIKILETKGIDLGKNPKRTLLFWRQIGLIPKPQIRNLGKKSGKHQGTASYYPIDTIAIIKEIRRLKEKGLTLSEIHDKFTKANVETNESNISGYNIEDWASEHQSATSTQEVMK